MGFPRGGAAAPAGQPPPEPPPTVAGFWAEMKNIHMFLRERGNEGIEEEERKKQVKMEKSDPHPLYTCLLSRPINRPISTDPVRFPQAQRIPSALLSFLFSAHSLITTTPLPAVIFISFARFLCFVKHCISFIILMHFYPFKFVVPLLPFIIHLFSFFSHLENVFRS